MIFHVRGRPWDRAARRQRLVGRHSTRQRSGHAQTTPEADETSRNIGSACLPLRACRPSGGFVLGTLGPSWVRSQPTSSEPCPPGVDNRVERYVLAVGDLWSVLRHLLFTRLSPCGNLCVSGLMPSGLPCETAACLWSSGRPDLLSEGRSTVKAVRRRRASAAEPTELALVDQLRIAHEPAS